MQMFIVIGMPRTGSTLVQTTLEQHPNIKMYGELFHPNDAERMGAHVIKDNSDSTFFDSTKDDAIDFLRANVWTEENSKKYDAVGFKLFGERVQCLGTEKLFLRLKETFPSLKFIHIERDDLLECWVSRETAKKTGQWFSSSQDKKTELVNDLQVVANPWALQQFFQSYEEVNNFFKSDFFAKPNYLHIDYDQIATDFKKTSCSIFTFLGLKNVSVKQNIKKQRTLTAPEQIQNIEEVRQFFDNSKYASVVGLPSNSNNEVNEKTHVAMCQNWIDNDNCDLAGIKISVRYKDQANLKTTADCVYALKGLNFFRLYSELTKDTHPKNVLELGIFEGGSAMLFADMWQEAKIVGIDLRPQNEEVIKHVQKLGFSERVKLFYGISQNDNRKVPHIIESEFHRKIDLVVDDASHYYELTKASFEIVFPYLANGGLYIIEDWAWAHWKEWQTPNHYSGSPALSNLVFELVMANASSHEIIESVTVTPWMCIIKKSKNCPSLSSNFKLDDIYFSRGKKLNLI